MLFRSIAAVTLPPSTTASDTVRVAALDSTVSPALAVIAPVTATCSAPERAMLTANSDQFRVLLGSFDNPATLEAARDVLAALGITTTRSTP